MPLGGCFKFELVEQLLEFLTVLGGLDRVNAGANDRHPRLLQSPSQVQRRLPAELHNHTIRMHHVANVEHVLDRERLEEQHVAGVVIGAYGFGIRIDHHRFDAQFAQREAGVAAAIVELDPLPDPIRPTAKNHDPLPAGRLGRHLVFVFVGGIVIRSVGLELGRTGVDGLERCPDAAP